MTTRYSLRFGAALLFAVCTGVYAQGDQAAASASAAMAPAPASAAVSDRQLAANVRHALHASRKQGLKSTYVRVRAKDGVVTLSGVVADAGQISRAMSIAQGVSGVRSVNSKIEVRADGGAPLGNQ